MLKIKEDKMTRKQRRCWRMSDTLSENYSKLNKRYQEIKNQLADLEAKLAESEKSKESYRLQIAEITHQHEDKGE